MDLEVAIKKITELRNKDQELRKSIPEDAEKAKLFWGEIEKHDWDSTNFLKRVVNKFGIPTISRFGAKTSYDAWLLVQHSPDLEFQKIYLKLMRENINDVNLKNIAYLEDRVLMYQGLPQTYGTQAITNVETGELEVYKLSDKNNVDVLRKEIGLEPLDKYLEELKSL